MLQIKEVVALYGELEWYSIRPGELANSGQAAPSLPPVITFRYKQNHCILATRLQAIVSQYEGNVIWEVGNVAEKNSFLMPSRVKSIQLERGFDTTMDSLEFIVKHEPQFVRQAVDDLPALLAFLKESASSVYDVGLEPCPEGRVDGRDS